VLYTFVLMATGVWLCASGLEGCLAGFGSVRPWERAFLIAGGFLFAFPEWVTTVIGFIMCVVVMAVVLVRKRRKGAVSLA